MELNLQNLFSQKNESSSDEVFFDVSQRDFGSFFVKAPLKMNYHALAKNGAVQITVFVNTVIEADCARCMQPFERTWEFERSFRITPQDLTQEFPELPFTENGGLDLEELVYSELLMDVDPVLLCKESCEGLCMQCGKSKTVCICKNDEPTQQVDPRWQALRDLLSEDDTRS